MSPVSRITDLRFVEDTTLSNHACPICGNEAAKGNRYCSECDYEGSGDKVARARTARDRPPQKSGGNVPLVLLLFMVTAFGTVLTGVFAPNVLSFPLMQSGAADSTNEWGELRVVRMGSRIRAQASTSSDVVGSLNIGDIVRVEPVPNGWFRVYSAELVSRMKAKPLGFVYGTLLDPAAPNVVSAGIADVGTPKRRVGR